jgi:hypothetical protein
VLLSGRLRHVEKPELVSVDLITRPLARRLISGSGFLSLEKRQFPDPLQSDLPAAETETPVSDAPGFFYFPGAPHKPNMNTPFSRGSKASS